MKFLFRFFILFLTTLDFQGILGSGLQCYECISATDKDLECGQENSTAFIRTCNETTPVTDLKVQNENLPKQFTPMESWDSGDVGNEIYYYCYEFAQEAANQDVGRAVVRGCGRSKRIHLNPEIAATPSRECRFDFGRKNEQCICMENKNGKPCNNQLQKQCRLSEL